MLKTTKKSNDRRIDTATTDKGVSAMDLQTLFKSSRGGLWGLFFFLLASILSLCLSHLPVAASLTADIVNHFGPAPPLILVNVILGISTFSSLVLIGGRIFFDKKPGKTGMHLWFRLYFFLQYFLNGCLSEYFNVLLISGLVVLGLHNYNVWNFYSRAIQQKMEQWQHMHWNTL